MTSPSSALGQMNTGHCHEGIMSCASQSQLSPSCTCNQNQSGEVKVLILSRGAQHIGLRASQYPCLSWWDHRYSQDSFCNMRCIQHWGHMGPGFDKRLFWPREVRTTGGRRNVLTSTWWMRRWDSDINRVRSALFRLTNTGVNICKHRYVSKRRLADNC